MKDDVVDDLALIVRNAIAYIKNLEKQINELKREPVQEPPRAYYTIDEINAKFDPPQRKPLDEDQMNEAYREIWRSLPSEFDHTASAWIEKGIRYAEQVHGITGDKHGS